MCPPDVEMTGLFVPDGRASTENGGAENTRSPRLAASHPGSGTRGDSSPHCRERLGSARREPTFCPAASAASETHARALPCSERRRVPGTHGLARAKPSLKTPDKGFLSA